MSLTNDAQHIEWLLLPHSRVLLTLDSQARARPAIEVNGNARGMLSLANVLLWLASLARGHDFLSLTALPFVEVEPGTLSLSIALELRQGGYDGRLVRLDNSQQYEWQIDDKCLERIGLVIHSLACHPEGDYFTPRLDPTSDAALEFTLMTDDRER